MPKPSGRLPAVTAKRIFTTRTMRKMAAQIGQVSVARWPAQAGPCPGAEALGLAWLQARQTGRRMVEMLDQVAANPRGAARTLALWVQPERRRGTRLSGYECASLPRCLVVPQLQREGTTRPKIAEATHER